MFDAKDLIRGGYDLHVHSAPDVLPRKMNDIEMARRIEESGMAGYAIKSHYFCTSERAQIIRELFPACDAVGTMTLNSSVGGINPSAVEMAARSGAKLIWFPTCDSAHERAYVLSGKYKKQPYWATIVQEMVRDRNIYGRKLIPIPMPQFVVFYNGDANQPERQELHLSDAFAKETDNPQLELKCQVYNINRGKNEEMLRACKWLEDYMTFVNKVRELHGNRSEEDLIVDIEMAIDYCVERNILRDFLISHRAEVTKSMKMDYTFDRQIELERDDAWTEGREEGRAEGREEGREEGRAEGREEGRAEGREEGREEGADQLFTAVQRLRQGTMEETLLAEGFAQNIIDKAKRLM